MRLGFALLQCGSAAGPDAITSVAQRAEAAGFDSLWVFDRTLSPVNPKAPYPVKDGILPVQFKRSLDPLATLLFAAAHTRRVALGTSVLNLPWINRSSKQEQASMWRNARSPCPEMSIV